MDAAGGRPASPNHLSAIVDRRGFAEAASRQRAEIVNAQLRRGPRGDSADRDEKHENDGAESTSWLHLGIKRYAPLTVQHGSQTS